MKAQVSYKTLSAGIKAAVIIYLGCFLLLSISGCTVKKAELGTEKNPIKLFFVPSVEAKTIEDNSRVFKEYLESKTPYKFSVSIPQSFIAVVEAFGSKRADIAALNTFGYILAHEKYGAEARLTVLRHGASTYQAQFLAKTGGPINTLADFAGKRVAFVDPASTTGFLLPKKVLNDRGIRPASEIFAMKHDSVVSMIYTDQVDAGATFHSPVHNGEIQDARRLVKTQYPDVVDKIKIVELSEPIPNDPIAFRKDLPEDIKEAITKAFLEFVETDDGRDAFEKIYGVTALKKATDQDYDSVRAMLQSLGTTADELMKK